MSYTPAMLQLCREAAIANNKTLLYVQELLDRDIASGLYARLGSPSSYQLYMQRAARYYGKTYIYRRHK